MRQALPLSGHSIERFIDRYRPEATAAEARAELQEIANGAAPTRRLTVKGDARVYVGTSRLGERVPLAVRDGVVVTVIPETGEGGNLIDMSADMDMMLESELDRRDCQRMAQALRGQMAQALRGQVEVEVKAQAKLALEQERVEQRKRAAVELLEDWKAGEPCSPRAVWKAHGVLGLKYDADACICPKTKPREAMGHSPRCPFASDSVREKAP